MSVMPTHPPERALWLFRTEVPNVKLCAVTGRPVASRARTERMRMVMEWSVKIEEVARHVQTCPRMNAPAKACNFPSPSPSYAQGPHRDSPGLQHLRGHA